MGAPFRAPISANLIVVMTTAPNGIAGSGSFSYQLIDAIEYPSYYKPFVGQDSAVWWATLIGVFLLPFILLVAGVFCCCYCKCCHCFTTDGKKIIEPLKVKTN